MCEPYSLVCGAGVARRFVWVFVPRLQIEPHHHRLARERRTSSRLCYPSYDGCSMPENLGFSFALVGSAHCKPVRRSRTPKRLHLRTRVYIVASSSTPVAARPHHHLRLRSHVGDMPVWMHRLETGHGGGSGGANRQNERGRGCGAESIEASWRRVREREKCRGGERHCAQSRLPLGIFFPVGWAG